MIVILDGRVTTLPEVSLATFPTAFAFGAGVFETMLVERGEPQHLGRHLRRMHRSLRALEGTIPACPGGVLDGGALRESVATALAKLAGSPDAFTGVMKIVAADGHVLVTFRDKPADRAEATGGVDIDEIEARTYRSGDPLRVHKTMSYLTNFRGMKRRLLFCNEAEQVCEAPTANVFVEMDGCLVTPPLDAPCLAGIMREILIEAGRVGDLPVVERTIRLDDLARARAAVLTNSVSIAVPVSRLLGRPLHRSIPLAASARELIRGADDAAT